MFITQMFVIPSSSEESAILASFCVKSFLLDFVTGRGLTDADALGSARRGAVFTLLSISGIQKNIYILYSHSVKIYKNIEVILKFHDDICMTNFNSQTTN